MSLPCLMKTKKRPTNNTYLWKHIRVSLWQGGSTSTGNTSVEVGPLQLVPSPFPPFSVVCRSSLHLKMSSSISYDGTINAVRILLHEVSSHDLFCITKLAPRVRLCACAVGVWLMCACEFVTKTMAVRMFQSAKLTNFGGNFFPIVHLFRLGNSGF